MDVTQALYEHLRNLGPGQTWGTRVYPGRLQASTSLPALVYQGIGGEDELTHSGGLGLRLSVIQVTCWGQTYGQARQGAESIARLLHGSQALVGLPVQAIWVEGGIVDIQDPDAGIYGSLQQFYIRW